jgi:2',3'-cyclic-nucleotide 2'-phosphodiesterase (5'-nucleotidase family)
MLKNSLRLSITLLIVGVLLALSSATGSLAQGEFKITILHNNDFESKLLPGKDGIGGIARFANYVKQVKATEERVLFLSGGDNVLSGPFFNFFLGEETYTTMSAAGYDASGLGNHEFDRGEQVIANALEKWAAFPHVISNLELAPDSPLRPLIGVKIFDTLILDIKGLKVGLFGILDPEIQTGRITQMAPGTNITDPITAAKRVVAELEAKGADLIIGIIHLAAALRLDTVIKQQVPGIDVFIVGGTDALFDPKANPADNVVETTKGPSLSVQGDGEGRAIGRLDLVVESGRIKSFDYVNLKVDETMGEDPQVAALVKHYADQVAALLDTPVGETLVTLDGKTSTNRQRETNIGSFITDCFLEVFPAAEIALHNGGGIRAAKSPGTLTFRDVQEITPFGNTIVLIDLTGAQLLEALENSVSAVEGTLGRYLQVSGLEYAYDLTQPPGKRVIPGTVKVSGQPLDPSRVYRVATLNFLVAGGDGYEVFTRAKNIIDTTFPQDAALVECVKKHSPIEPFNQGRIRSIIGLKKLEAADGDTVKFRGITTVATGTYGRQDIFWVQEAADGIEVRLKDVPRERVPVGAFVEVRGTFKKQDGKVWIDEAEFDLVTKIEFPGVPEIKFNVQPHEPQTVKLWWLLANLNSGVYYQGNLVRLEGVTVGEATKVGRDTLVKLIDEKGNEFYMLISVHTGIAGLGKDTKLTAVVGIVDIANFGGDVGIKAFIAPRTPDDIKVAQ